MISLFGLSILSVTAASAQEKAATKQPAKLTILVPQEDATLYFFDKPSVVTGAERTYATTDLEPGEKYYFKLKVFWEPNNYTKITRFRRIEVKAGGTYTVDFRKADADSPDDVVVRYVPTPDEVVAAMLKLANVGKGDVVFDLGCGDGRIVIDAVRKSGAKSGVGVDIDPQRIKESRANAEAAQVSAKVKFREGDVLAAIDDLADASVVMLYMGDFINNRLRPRMRTQLKPGSRVVSHRFLMGDWKPDKTITVKDAEGTDYQLHLWNIDASTKDLEKVKTEDTPRKSKP
ncbi:MAG: TIGR03000 domain-containing protein [Planctomycetota bacterium]|nr:TIGR03000 domain-containing protein [Planctomycetota bacterium]